jgi:hypothetical protein
MVDGGNPCIARAVFNAAGYELWHRHLGVILVIYAVIGPWFMIDWHWGRGDDV